MVPGKWIAFYHAESRQVVYFSSPLLSLLPSSCLQFCRFDFDAGCTYRVGGESYKSTGMAVSLGSDPVFPINKAAGYPIQFFIFSYFVFLLLLKICNLFCFIIFLILHRYDTGAIITSPLYPYGRAGDGAYFQSSMTPGYRYIIFTQEGSPCIARASTSCIGQATGKYTTEKEKERKER